MVLRWKIEAKFWIQWQKWSFWAQISPLLPPGYTNTDSGNLYLGMLWSEEAYLAINTFINEYRELSVKKLRQICRSSLKMGHFEARISHFSSCRYSKNHKNYSKFMYVDIRIIFLAPRNLPMHKMRPKLSFCRVNFAFRCILGHFGPILGPMTSLKGPRIEIFISSTSESYSLHQKTYQCIVFGSRTLFYERLLRYQCQILIKKTCKS